MSGIYNHTNYTRLLQIISILTAFALFGMTVGRWFLDLLPVSLDKAHIFFGPSYTFNNNLWFEQLPSLTATQRLLGFFVDCIGLLILYRGIMYFNVLLRLLRSNGFFANESISLVHKLNRIALYWVMYCPLSHIILSVVTTWHKGVGNRIVSVQVGANDIVNIFIFGCLVLLTYVMQESVKLKKDQEFTI